MKKLICAAIFLAVFSAEAMPDKRPLILGASVSADWMGKSPGRMLAEDAGQKYDSIAHAGDPGSLSRLFGSLSDEALGKASIIYAIDPLFWDTYKPADIGMGALEKFLSRTKAADVPVVLGNAPSIEVSPLVRFFAGAKGDTQQSLSAINAKAAELCTPENNCTLMDILSRVNTAKKDGSLMPDGLHISDKFSRTLADEIRERLDAGR